MKLTLQPAHPYFALFVATLLALLVAMSPLAIDTYLSAMPIMASDLHVGLGYVELTLTLYFLGFAFGNFIGGPLSDAFGRKAVALLGVLMYGVSAYLITLSNTIETIWALRFLQAFGGGFSSVTAMVFVKDWFQGKQVAKLATLITMIMMFAPMLAPIIGAVLLSAWNWHAIFLFLSLYAAVMFTVFIVFMPESRPREFITRKLTAKQFFGNYGLFFQCKPAVLVLLSISFSVSGMFAFITGASFIYLDYFDMPLNIFPVLFGTNVALNVILSLLNTVLLKRFETQNLLKIGMLIQLFAGSLILVSAIIFKHSFWPIFIGIALYIGSLGMVFGNGNALILNLLPNISGSANATIGVTRFIFSFIAGSIPALFVKTDLIPIAGVMFACSVLGNALFVFFQNVRSQQAIADVS